MSRTFLNRLAALSATALRRDDGNVAIIVALAAPMFVGAGALAVETSYDYSVQTRLQAAADAAAYAGSLDNAAGLPASQITADAMAAARTNGWSGTSAQIQVNNPPRSGADTTAQAVEVIVQQGVPRFFTAVFSDTPVLASARSVAVYRGAGNACILALNKTAAQAVQVQGSTTVNLVGCDVMSNSIANNSINIWGNAKLTANCVSAAGNVAINKDNATLACGAPIIQAPRAKDPFASLPAPSPGNNRSVPNGQNVTLNPGNYNSGMNLKNNITMNPGTYYVSGGDFKVNAGAVVTGSGVTIYLQNGSSVSINGNSHISISAPQSGTYSGILFFGDRNATSGSATINGDDTSSLTGDMYFPSQPVSFLGNFSGKNGCMQIIADTVTWTGNSTVGVDCAAQGMTPIPSRQAVKITQ